MIGVGVSIVSVALRQRPNQTPAEPPNAITLGGQALTLGGQYLTLGA